MDTIKEYEKGDPITFYADHYDRPLTVVDFRNQCFRGAKEPEEDGWHPLEKMDENEHGVSLRYASQGVTWIFMFGEKEGEKAGNLIFLTKHGNTKMLDLYLSPQNNVPPDQDPCLEPA